MPDGEPPESDPRSAASQPRVRELRVASLTPVNQLCLLGAGAGATASVLLAVYRPSTAPLPPDGVVLALLCLTFLLLAVSAWHASTAEAWRLLGAHAVGIGFLIRLVPNLVDPYPPLHDPYFYFISTQNLAAFHTFTPALAGWFPNVGKILDWPFLQIATIQLSQILHISPFDVSLYINAALGSLAFFSISLLAHALYPSWKIASLAGLIASFSDAAMFYQSEYHPQGVALVLFPFLVFLIVRSRHRTGIGPRALVVIVSAVFLFSHYASSLLLPLFLLPLAAFPVLGRSLRSVPRLRTVRPAEGFLRDLAGFETVVILLVVGGLALQLYMSDAVLALLIHDLGPAASSFVSQARAPSLWLDALRLYKYTAFLLAIAGAWLVWRQRVRSGALLLVLLGSLSIALAISSIVIGSSDRLLAFGEVFGAVLAATGLCLYAAQTSGARARLLAAVAVVWVSGYCVVGTLLFSEPAYFLRGSPQSGGAWYGNTVPATDMVRSAGSWIRTHTGPAPIYFVDFFSYMAPEYFGGVPYRHVLYGPSAMAHACSASVVVVRHDTRLDALDPFPRLPPLETFDRVYDNGGVAVWRREPAKPCSPQSSPTTKRSATGGGDHG